MIQFPVRASGKFFCVPMCLQNWLVWFGLSIQQWLLSNGITTDPFSVTNGLRQGCTMAPVLFTIYMRAVVSCWQQRIGELNDVGIEFRYKCSNSLYRPSRRSDPTAKHTEC